MPSACVVLLSVACRSLTCIYKLSHKRRDFRGVIEHKTCVLSFSTASIRNILTLRIIQRDMITNAHASSCNTTVILVRLQQNMNFLGGFSKSAQISNFMAICPVGASVTPCGWRNGQTGMMKPIGDSAILRTRLKWRSLTHHFACPADSSMQFSRSRRR